MKYFAITTIAIIAGIFALAIFEMSAKADAEKALYDAGFRPTEIRLLTAPVCMRNRFGYEFRQGRIRGKVCAGGLMRPAITVY